jgi:signal peptidase I
MEPNVDTTMSHSTPQSASPLPEPRRPSTFGEILRFAIIALVIVIPIRIFVAQPFIVSGASMEPTFHNGQYLIVDQLSYHTGEPKRGDVIIFKYPKDPSKYFIKRLVGIPGDTVSINGNVITIMNEANPEGFVLDEPYVAHMNPNTTLTEVLGPGEYFVMGDNRDNSSDSRVWGILHEDLIVGRAFLRLFPVDEVGYLPGHIEQSDTSTTN